MDNDKKTYTLLYGLAVIFLITAFISPLIFTGNCNYSHFGKDSGPIGDTIGGLTAPFLSIAGSILVFAALRAQIDANQQVQKQFNSQEEKNSVRDFENTFFQMLNIQHNLVNKNQFDIKSLFQSDQVIPLFFDSKSIEGVSITINHEQREKPFEGQEIFSSTLYYYERILSTKHSHFLALKLEDKVKDLESNQTSIRSSKYKTEAINFNQQLYDLFYSKLDTNFGNYYRNLYRIVKQIDEFTFDKNDPQKCFEKKYYYTSILRAQLSDSEVHWLLFNGLTKYGKKFKPLIERYSLLKILESNENHIIQLYSKFYDQSAYKPERSYSGLKINN